MFYLIFFLIDYQCLIQQTFVHIIKLLYRATDSKKKSGKIVYGKSNILQNVINWQNEL